ncbi:MAG: ORF6N domain-containing protein [Bacilli bacterium]|nr:ORF6N domain-containing protein [Bacilli bacterium]
MNEIIEKEVLNIKNMIYEINGVEVMFDYDLAELYHVETKRINEAVKRNIRKFPERFSWLINQNDFKNLEVAKCDLTIKNGNGGRRYDIRVFTEQGVAMLATILKSKEAINTSIQIMDAFVKMRHYINYSNQLLPNRFLLLEDKVDNNTKRIDELFDKFNPKDIAKNYLFFEGELYDAYSVVMTILKKAKKEIIIIDNYAGKELLDILKNVDKKITIVSKNIDDVLKKKYESQYNNVTFINNDSFHDRFIIVDKKKLYSSGASFKDLGKKCFAINEMDNEDFLKLLLMDIKKRHN